MNDVPAQGKIFDCTVPQLRNYRRDEDDLREFLRLSRRFTIHELPFGFRAIVDKQAPPNEGKFVDEHGRTLCRIINMGITTS